MPQNSRSSLDNENIILKFFDVNKHEAESEFGTVEDIYIVHSDRPTTSYDGTLPWYACIVLIK
jgi:hypothetical protein